MGDRVRVVKRNLSVRNELSVLFMARSANMQLWISKFVYVELHIDVSLCWAFRFGNGRNQMECCSKDHTRNSDVPLNSVDAECRLFPHGVLWEETKDLLQYSCNEQTRYAQ